MKKIKTSGDLRSYLCDLITEVHNGTVDTDKARAVMKLSAQVTESIYAEAKVAKLKIEIGKEVDRFGHMQLGNSVK